jgi:hypothetical protein
VDLALRDGTEQYSCIIRGKQEALAFRQRRLSGQIMVIY